MGPWNKSDGQSSKRIECKGLYNDTEEGRSLKPIARWTTQGRTHCGIKVKIYGTLLLYSKERWFITVGSRLQEVKPSHNKGQDATISDWRSNRQAQRDKILQQIRLDLGIQQFMNQRRRWIEGCISNQQRTIRTSSDVLLTIQLTRNLSKNDK